MYLFIVGSLNTFMNVYIVQVCTKANTTIKKQKNGMEIPNIYATYLSLGLKPRSQMPLPTATDAGRTIFKQWKFGKTMEKRGDSYEIIVRTNLCDRSVTYILTHLESELRDYINRILVTTASADLQTYA